MLPGELSYLVAELLHEVNSVKENNIDDIRSFSLVLSNFKLNWRSLWATYVMNKAGWQAYHQCRDTA
jgi:hypothetical protein